jgi:hypothetical protein
MRLNTAVRMPRNNGEDIRNTFCIESASPSREFGEGDGDMQECRTPTPMDLECPFQAMRKDNVMSRGDMKQSPLIDVTGYSDTILGLMQDGKILREHQDETRDLVANNVKLRRLDSFGGVLYGISVNNRMYRLNNDTFDTNKWRWTLDSSFPNGVVHTSPTLNGKYFWVQTSSTGQLFNRKGEVVDRTEMSGNRRRVYGNRRNTYVEIDPRTQSALVMPNQTRVNDVVDALVTHDNQLKILRPSQTQNFSSLRLVNWKPTYIRRVLS